MTEKILIDRATLEQIVEELEGVEALIEHQYTGTRESMNALQPRFDAAITAGRTALANAEPAGVDYKTLYEHTLHQLKQVMEAVGSLERKL